MEVFLDVISEFKRLFSQYSHTRTETPLEGAKGTLAMYSGIWELNKEDNKKNIQSFTII